MDYCHRRTHGTQPLRSVLFVAAILLMLIGARTTFAQPTTLRILAPNGGENLVVDSTTKIRWLATGLTGSMITIEYTADSGATWHFIDTVTARTGLDSLPWVVPNDTTHRALVRLTDSARTSRSQRVFNIVLQPVPTLQVLYPNGFEQFAYDSTVKVRWTGTNLSGQLEVQYSIDSGVTWKPIQTVTAHNGTDSLMWTVPHDSTTKAFLRVRTTDSAVSDRSNRTFTIRASALQPSIKLLYPNGGEVFKADSNIRVRWTGTDLIGQVIIEYSVDSGATWKPAGTKTARTGADSMGWKIPNDSSRKALVRVSVGTTRDTSDAVFTINGTVVPPTVLRMLYPNGGEHFRVDSVIHIRWHAEGLTGQVALRFSSNGGRTFTPLDSATAKEGDDSLTWTIPNVITDSAVVRIGWTGHGMNDASDAMFSIAAKPDTGAGVTRGAEMNAGALALVGCYPNPATSSTEVRWTQGLPGDVSLRVIDPSGRVVQTVAAGHREPGPQAIEIGTAALPSGTYLYEIVLGTMRTTGIVTVVR